MIRHPFSEALAHDFGDLHVEIRVIRVDAEDLRPAFPTSVLECLFDVFKGLLDLGAEIAGDVAPVVADATYVYLAAAIERESCSDFLFKLTATYLDRTVRFGLLRAPPGYSQDCPLRTRPSRDMRST